MQNRNVIRTKIGIIYVEAYTFLVKRNAENNSIVVDEYKMIIGCYLSLSPVCMHDYNEKKRIRFICYLSTSVELD